MNNTCTIIRHVYLILLSMVRVLSISTMFLYTTSQGTQKELKKLIKWLLSRFVCMYVCVSKILVRKPEGVRFVAFPATEYDEVLSGCQPGQMVER
jgi:hypothetical protein